MSIRRLIAVGAMFIFAGVATMWAAPPPPKAPPGNPNAKEIAADRDELGKASRAYEELVKKLTDQCEQSADFTAAAKEAGDANTAYDSAKATMLASLREKPEYKQALISKETAEKKLKDLQAKKGSEAELPAVAKETLEARRAVTKIETDAAEADPSLQEKNAAAKAATDKLAKMRTDFRESLAQNADVVAAKKAKEDAAAKLASHKPATQPR